MADGIFLISSHFGEGEGLTERHEHGIIAKTAFASRFSDDEPGAFLLDGEDHLILREDDILGVVE